jgi:hypothetical protein
MKDEKSCSLILVRNDKRLTGTAAQLAHISDCGGWDAFLENVAYQVVGSFVKTYNEAARRPNLHVVGSVTHRDGDR